MTSSPGNPGPPAGMRASDADRERVAEELRRHHVDGRLDTDELQDRLGRCYAARTGAELAALLADLPGEDRAGAPHRHRTGGGFPVGPAIVGVLLVALLFATFGAIGHGHHPGPFPFLAVLLVLKLAWGGPRRRPAAWGGARRG